MVGWQGVLDGQPYAAVQGHPAEAYILDIDLMKEHAPEMHQDVFGEPLPVHVLAAPGGSPEWVRHFGGRSSQADRARAGG